MRVVDVEREREREGRTRLSESECQLVTTTLVKGPTHALWPHSQSPNRYFGGKFYSKLQICNNGTFFRIPNVSYRNYLHLPQIYSFSLLITEYHVCGTCTATKNFAIISFPTLCSFPFSLS